MNVLISKILKLSRIHKQLRDATQCCAPTVKPVFVVVACVCVCVCGGGGGAYLLPGCSFIKGSTVLEGK